MEKKNESLESFNQETSNKQSTGNFTVNPTSSDALSSSLDETSLQKTSSSLDEDEPLQDEEEFYYEDDEEDGRPPVMPERLPSLIRLLVSRTPKIYKPTVAQAVFPSLAA